jgi:hypothetical protein
MSVTASPTNATGRTATRTDLHAGAGLEAARLCRKTTMGRVRGPRSASARPDPAPGRVRPMLSPAGNTDDLMAVVQAALAE